ncbi:DUF3973 domain-containing protein [Paenibacillus alginolyticus]|uniref:DUF3973 domain-containing protein n=1 Tax=Paenibacillus alginolyticus TaxID=59839 RepID=UPI000FDC4908|nr:DUF3973 domain-containing protein [Paenibacillus alginolyticus]MCY9663431.1 DUF3973 domain-containing protein [Paenibacillus alginolyticus]
MKRKAVSDTYYCIQCKMLHEAHQSYNQGVTFRTGFFYIGREIYPSGFCQNDINHPNNRLTTENDVSDA